MVRGRFIALVLSMVFVCCQDSRTGTVGDTATPPPDGTVLCPNFSCMDHCDPFSGACVACVLPEQCPDEHLCVEGSCVPTTDCQSQADCDLGFCDGQAGICVECLTDSQCPQDQYCLHGNCVGPTTACSTDIDCPNDDRCHPSYNLCLPCATSDDCATNERCGAAGQCVPRECLEGQARCEEGKRQLCGPDGLFMEPESCPAGEACFDGACTPITCTPGVRTCSDLQLSTCNLEGSAFEIQPCPPGSYCPDGQTDCVAVQNRAILLVDTSGSMRRYPGTEILVDECDENNMPCPSPWPTCETEENALSLISKSKVALRNILNSTDLYQRLDLALMRFPQSVRGYHTCGKGHYKGEDAIEGDTGAHQTPASSSGWFQAGLEQVLCVGFSGGGDKDEHLDQLLSWMDFVESASSTGQSCGDDDDCATGFCDSGCKMHDNPEIRATGYTPIGKTLFYAGEYLRHEVFVDGTPCSQDSDCGVSGYQCDSGQCVDPIAHCRKNAIILLSDGTESIHMAPTDFFHPWVQAKRLAYGLGCADDADCLGGSICVGGACSAPSSLDGVNACSNHGELCEQGDDCGQTGAVCSDVATQFTDAQGSNVLRNANGQAVRVQVHAVDIDIEGPGNQWIAVLGGGSHYTVSSADPENFLSTLLLATDIKTLETCVPAP